MKEQDRAAFIAGQIKRRTDIEPLFAIVLGSGWNGVTEFLQEKTVIPYGELEEMPVCGVEGHAGNFVFGKIGGKGVVALQGRFHLYEGGGTQRAVLPIGIARCLGADILVLTNSAGGINRDYRPGDLMVLRDHINLTARNPLEGVKAAEDFPVFIDLGSLYDRKLSGIMEQLCAEIGIPVHAGVYAQMLGPSYETPAEVQMLSRLGADAVGMSTAVEAIYAKYLKMRVVAVSCISNPAAGISPSALDHKEVLAVLRQRREKLSELLHSFVLAV